MWRKSATSSTSVGGSSTSLAETAGAASSSAGAAAAGVPPATPAPYYPPLSTSYPPYQHPAHHSGTTVWSLLFSGVGAGHGGWSWLTTALELMLCYFTYVHPIYVGAAICRRASIIAGDLAATVSSPNSPTLVTPREVSNCVIAFALLWVLEMLDQLFLRDFIAMRNVYLFARILFCTYLFHPKFHGALVMYERFGIGALVDTYGTSVDDFLVSNMSFLKNNGVVEFALKVLRFGTGWSKEILYVMTQLLLPSSSAPSSSPTDALASSRSPSSKLLPASSAAAILAGAKNVTGGSSSGGGSTVRRGNDNNVYYGLNDDADEVLGVPSATAADLSTSAAMKVAVGSRAATPLRGRRGHDHEDAHKTTPSKSKKKTHEEEEKREEGAKDKKEKREKKEKKEKNVDTTPERKVRDKQKETDAADQQQSLRVPHLHVGTDLLLSKGGGGASVTPRTAFNSLVSAIDARGSPSATTKATTSSNQQHRHDDHEYDLLMDDEDLNDLIEGIATKNHIRKERLSVTAVSSSNHHGPHSQQPSVPPPQMGTLRDGQRPSDSVNAAAARTLKLFSSRTLTSPSPTDAAAATVSQMTLRAELAQSVKAAKGLSEAMFEDLEVSLL